MLVEETEVIYPFAPWRYPEAVRFVPEALVKKSEGNDPYPETLAFVPDADVKFKVGNKPYPLADIFVVDTLVAVRFVKVGLTETPMVSPPVVDVTTWMMVPEEFTWLKIRGRDVVE